MNERVYYSEEAKAHARRQRVLAIILSLGLGLSIGAFFALLFAPEKGENMRGDLASTISDRIASGRDATQSRLEQLGDEVSALRKSVEEKIG